MPFVSIKVYRDGEGRIIPVNIRKEFSINARRRRSVEVSSSSSSSSAGNGSDMPPAENNDDDISNETENPNTGEERGQADPRNIGDSEDEEMKLEDYEEAEKDGEGDEGGENDEGGEGEEEGEYDEEGQDYDVEDDDDDGDPFDDIFGPSGNAGGGGSSAWVAQVCSKIMKKLSSPDVPKSRDPMDAYDLTDELIDDSETTYTGELGSKRKSSSTPDKPPKKKKKTNTKTSDEDGKKKKKDGDLKKKKKKDKKDGEHEKKDKKDGEHEKKEKKDGEREKKKKKDKKDGEHEKKEKKTGEHKKKEKKEVKEVGDVIVISDESQLGEKGNDAAHVKRCQTSVLPPPKEGGKSGSGELSSSTVCIKDSAAKKKSAAPKDQSAAKSAATTSESSQFISQDNLHLDSLTSSSQASKEKKVITEDDILHYKVPEEFPGPIRDSIRSFHEKYIKDRSLKVNDFIAELSEVIQKNDSKGIVSKVAVSLSEFISLQPQTLRKKINVIVKGKQDEIREIPIQQQQQSTSANTNEVKSPSQKQKPVQHSLPPPPVKRSTQHQLPLAAALTSPPKQQQQLPPPPSSPQIKVPAQQPLPQMQQHPLPPPPVKRPTQHQLTITTTSTTSQQQQQQQIKLPAQQTQQRIIPQPLPNIVQQQPIYFSSVQPQQAKILPIQSAFLPQTLQQAPPSQIQRRQQLFQQQNQGQIAQYQQELKLQQKTMLNNTKPVAQPVQPASNITIQVPKHKPELTGVFGIFARPHQHQHQQSTPNIINEVPLTPDPKPSGI